MVKKLEKIVSVSSESKAMQNSIAISCVILIMYRTQSKIFVLCN